MARPTNREAQIGPRVGDVVAGRYVLVTCIGSGGMGVVWHARHRTLGHDVALKFMYCVNRSARARFDREAKLSARLGELSRHIVRVFDHGLPDEVPFVAMELLRGETLAERLARERTLPPSTIVCVVSHLCKALATSHAEGVVHRDLKPANVFLSRLPEDDNFVVKLLDFGVAKGDSGSDDSISGGVMLGTLSYMSPEQLLGEPQIDSRVDLWSLAVLVYRLAVGVTPFSFGPRADLVARIVGCKAPPPSLSDPRLPAALDEWFEVALAKKREHRFQDAAELARTLVEAFGPALCESATFQRAPACAVPAAIPPFTNEAITRTEPLPQKGAAVGLDQVQRATPQDRSAPRKLTRKSRAASAVGLVVFVVGMLGVLRSPSSPIGQEQAWIDGVQARTLQERTPRPSQATHAAPEAAAPQTPNHDGAGSETQSAENRDPGGRRSTQPVAKSGTSNGSRRAPQHIDLGF